MSRKPSKRKKQEAADYEAGRKLFERAGPPPEAWTFIWVDDLNTSLWRRRLGKSLPSSFFAEFPSEDGPITAARSPAKDIE